MTRGQGRAARLGLLLALLGGLGQAGADMLPLTDWPTTERPTYIRVPGQQEYRQVSVRLLSALPGAVPPSRSPAQQAEILLNNRVVGLTSLGPEVRFALPNLSAGTYELRLRTTTVRPGGCAATGDAVPLRQADLNFVSISTGQSQLSALPDGLFPPGRPELAVGVFRADEWNDQTLSAALGLTQVMSSVAQSRPLLWQSRPQADLPADFTVELRRTPELSAPAHLSLQPGKLQIRYRRPADLTWAVSTLALPTLRGKLQGPEADITSSPLLPHPRLAPPRTLADLGFGPYSVRSGTQVSQALLLPPLWQANGPLTGSLHYRLPKAPTPQTEATLLLGNRRVNVSPANAMRQGNEFQSAFRGPLMPDEGLDLTLLASGLSACQDTLQVQPGSAVDFHARRRAGLASLPGLLAEAPSVALPANPEAIDAALNLAASLHRWGLRDVLPWQAHLLSVQSRGTNATLMVQPGPRDLPPSSRQPEARFSLERVSLTRMQARLTLPGGQTAPRELVRAWARVPQQLSDHLNDVSISPDGQVRAARPQASASAPSAVRRWALWFSLLALPLWALWLAFRSARRRTE